MKVQLKPLADNLKNTLLVELSHMILIKIMLRSHLRNRAYFDFC